MNYAIIGTGAIGGFYGGKLAQAGREVHFLFHSEYEAAVAQGLRVDSVDGDFSIRPVRAYRDTHDMPACDVILVALKTTVNDRLPELLAPILRPGSLVVLIQNGLGIEADLADRLPAHVGVAGGMGFICSNRIGPAHIHHLDYGRLTVGLYRGDETKCRTFLDELADAGVETVWAPDLAEARWRKLVWNIPYNGLSVVLDTTTEALMAHPSSRALVRSLMIEVQHGAAACGITIPDTFIDEMLAMTDRMRPYKPSMRLDYDHRRPMEIEAIYSRPVREARTRGVELPRIETLERQLRFIEKKYLP
ncbi:MAG: putative 2-dehydropantoate 2-reductase [Paludibacteraceae bacterium]|nr:putative 2-dehydropantoate 2-reductase [Paludibacteraceae bacterium]